MKFTIDYEAYIMIQYLSLRLTMPLKRGEVGKKELMSEEAKRKKKVYVETSFVSYLTGRATTREPIASWQAASRQWWEAACPFSSRSIAIPGA